ncbi:UNVERIFIED_CONTAM: hypothetical protein Sindi_2029400 [Sesamum indicum]
MRPQGVTEEQVKLRAFPFSLGDKAKDWLYSLPSKSIVSWNELKKQFLENYFPTSRTTNIRKEISGIRQFFGESFYEYWGRFKQLVESCPHHQIPDHLLIQYFYEGLSEANRSLVDAASGGALYDKTPIVARKLITTMAANNQQFGTRNDNPPRRVNEVSTSIGERLPHPPVKKPFNHLGVEKYFCDNISNMPVWNRINLAHVEHYRLDIIMPIVLFLDVIGHLPQYDTVNLSILMPLLECQTFLTCGPFRQGLGKRPIQNIGMVLKI